MGKSSDMDTGANRSSPDSFLNIIETLDSQNPGVEQITLAVQILKRAARDLNKEAAYLDRKSASIGAARRI